MGARGVVKRIDTRCEPFFIDRTLCTDRNAPSGEIHLMNTEQPELQDHQTQNWPLPRMVAFSAMLFTIASLSAFAVVAIFLNVARPDLGEESLFLPILGALLMTGTLAALVGLLAGVIDLTRSQGKRGITVVSVVVNSIASLLVFAIITIGRLNT